MIYKNSISNKDVSKWKISKIKSSLSISLSSKIGTGAIIGVLAAMWQTSNDGIGGQSIVLWILIGMFILVPITYSEVLFTQVTKKLPRQFISDNISKTAGKISSLCLAILFSFGFVGFQFTGIQNVLKTFILENSNYKITHLHQLLYIVIPLLILAFLIIITKSYKVFINTLGSLILIIIIIYSVYFILFLIKTRAFIPVYFLNIWKDFLNFKTASIGLPIGLIVGFQRIIQISETGLGTSSLSSSDANNSPRREALLQTIATLITIFIAVAITSYIFEYGRYNVSNVSLTSNVFEQISVYFKSASSVINSYGIVIILFFLLSGFTTILSSFHFIYNSINISYNKKIAFYMFLIITSSLLSVANFNIIFDIVDLLMFITVGINITAMIIFSIKNINKYRINKTEE